MFTTELYGILSEVLVGAAAVATMYLGYWIVRCGEDLRFIVYFRRKLEFFFDREHSQNVAAASGGGDSKRVESTEKSSGPRENLLLPVVGAVVIGLGLSVQSTLDDLTDPHPVGYDWLGKVVALIFPSKEATRFSALYRRVTDHTPYPNGYPSACSKKDPFDDYELTSLGREVLLNEKELIASSIPLSLPVTESLSNVKVPGETLSADEAKVLEARLWREFLGNPSDFLKREDRAARCYLVQGVAISLYYDGNNWAHRSDTVVAALRRWQIQIDTLGSVSMLSLVIVLVTSLYLLCTFIHRSLYKGATMLKEKRQSVKWWLAASLVSALFCLYGYAVGSKAYIGRVIGMYSSAHHNEDVKLSLVGCHTLVRFWNSQRLDRFALTDNPESPSPWCNRALIVEKIGLERKSDKAATGSASD